MEHPKLMDALTALYPVISGTRDSMSLITSLSEEEYWLGTRALNNIARVVEKWPAEPLSVQDEDLIWALACECYESAHICDWKDVTDIQFPEWNRIRSEEERMNARMEAKKMWVSDIEECREHLALRLCANAANKIAHVLGEGRGDLRVYFENGQHSRLDEFSTWELDIEAPYGLRTLVRKLFDK